jgi:hypothetical protein
MLRLEGRSRATNPIREVSLPDQAPIPRTIAITPGFGSADVASWSKFAVRTLLSKIPALAEIVGPVAYL